jgi:outer membrane receptor protein involved in Fe transport
VHAFRTWRPDGAGTGHRLGLFGRTTLLVSALIAGTAAVAVAQPPAKADTGKQAGGVTTSADSAAAAAYIDSIAGGPMKPMGAPHTHADSVRKARADSLARIAVRLGSVTITASPPTQSDPIDVVRVTPSIIAQTPSNSPWQLLQETAGLEVHQQGQGPGFASDMSIRGFSSDHSTDMALWVDGVPINEPVNGHAEGYNDFTTIFPEVVSGIDVIKGPTSAVYGNFAFSGVVNVRTLDRIDNTQLDVSGGNYGNYEGVLLSGFDNGSTAGMIGIRATHEDGWRSHSENQIGQLHGRLEHNLSSNTTVDLGMEAYITTYNSPGFLDTLDYDLRHYNDVSNFGDGGFKRRFQERGSIRTLFNPNLEWRTTLYGIEDTWNFWLSTPPGLGGLLEGSGVETRESDGRTGGGATSALTYTSGHVNITAGGQARYDNSDYGNWGEFATATAFRRDSVPFGLTSAHQASGGLFVQSNFDVTHWLRFDLGGRVDQIDSYSHTPTSYTDSLPAPTYYALGPYADLQHSKGIFSPKTGLLLRLLPWAGVYANISRGWRQADGVIFAPSTPLITVWDYETGVKLGEGPWSLEAAFFRMDLSNTQVFNEVSTISGGPSKRRGVDVSGRYVVTPAVLLSTNFTVVDAKYTRYYDTDVDIDYSGRPVFNTSKFVGDAALEVHPPRAIWQWRLGTNFQGKYTPFEEAVGLYRPAFALFYTSGGVQLRPDAHLEIGIRNLLNTQYRELESGYFVTPGQPISVFATLHYDVPL